MNRTFRQKINNKIDLNKTVAQMNLINIPSNSKRILFFSKEHGTFSRTSHTLGHKTNLNKFKKAKNALVIISDDNGMKL